MPLLPVIGFGFTKKEFVAHDGYPVHNAVRSAVIDGSAMPSYFARINCP
jgi:hypothetical protein